MAIVSSTIIIILPAFLKVHAEETLQSLNFAPDAFAVRTNSVKDVESKGSLYHPGDEKFHEDSQEDFTQMYFVQTLPSHTPKQGQMQRSGTPADFQSNSTAPSFYAYSTSNSDREERSFFTE